MHKYLLSVLALLVLGLCPYATQAASPLAQAIEERYKNITAFEASFIQRLVHLDSGAEEERSGTLIFQKPQNIYWEIAKPHAELLVLNNKALWNYLPKEGTATKYKPELTPETRMLLDVLTGQSALLTNFSVDEEGEEAGLVQLRLIPHEPSTQLTEALLWADRQEKLVRKIQIIDFYGNINEMRFTKLNINPAVKAGQFSFAPPKGVNVFDKSTGSDAPELPIR